MRTSATNRKIRVLLTAIREDRLLPRPEFQRKLVWSNKHKQRFLDTVLLGYPFPEIYIAAGNVDPTSAEGNELLVDGQQRITTLLQYFLGSPDLDLGPITPYADLPLDDQFSFLEYEVVVRDLGHLSLKQIREVFTRINSTQYALNAMELHNAMYDGQFKRFGELVASDRFFERHRVFRTTEVRRMADLRFSLTLAITMLSSYFNRDEELATYLQKYNDEFEQAATLKERLGRVFKFVDACELSDIRRVWQKADLLTLLVEIDRALNLDPIDIVPSQAGLALRAFFDHVNEKALDIGPQSADSRSYYLAAVQASNDRGSRITRGRIVREVLAGSLH